MKTSKIFVRGWEPAIRGMRNPLESHNKSDSLFIVEDNPVIGENDMELMKKLIDAGSSHRKFLRQIMIWCDVKASLKFFDEFSTYEFTVSNSTSQMHTLGSRVLTENDFENIDIDLLNFVNRKIINYQQATTKKNWREMIDAIPQSFLYTRTLMFSYETFLTIYPNRKNHKMFEWRNFCMDIRMKAPYMNDFCGSF
jgi:hypothetical protein